MPLGLAALPGGANPTGSAEGANGSGSAQTQMLLNGDIAEDLVHSNGSNGNSLGQVGTACSFNSSIVLSFYSSLSMCLSKCCSMLWNSLATLSFGVVT
jgi:hypothetical protein